ncbi:MAG TPA: hypothetical protein VMG58_03065 [Candidatus Sulfotelmatobacter sp.]|nr:hypothetical protein [Candidatus Sulfotelmatobacter sp.]
MKSQQPRNDRLNPCRVGFALLAGAYGLRCAFSPSTYRFLDGVDLVFHEAGHVVFGFFGEFIGVLGGSLMQVLIPAVAAFALLCQRQPYSASVVLVWVGQSLFNVSVYVCDARRQALPLLGGEDVTHDWGYLLGRLGLLRWDGVLANGVYLLGLTALLAGVLGALYLSWDSVADR